MPVISGTDKLDSDTALPPWDDAKREEKEALPRQRQTTIVTEQLSWTESGSNHYSPHQTFTAINYAVHHHMIAFSGRYCDIVGSEAMIGWRGCMSPARPLAFSPVTSTVKPLLPPSPLPPVLPATLFASPIAPAIHCHSLL